MLKIISILALIFLCSFLPVSFSQSYTNISVSEAKTMIDSFPSLVVLDVRDQSEYDSGHIRNAKLIPNSELAGRLDELNPTDLILVYCKLGGRSATASQTLVDNGFLFVYNMLGGVTAWINEGYPVFVKYSTIQGAVNNANEDGALYISSSTYNENIVVNKALSIIGEDLENTIINGNTPSPAVTFIANNSIIESFTITSTSDYNIAVLECSNVTISGNQILSSYGILTENSENIKIGENQVINCTLKGIFLVNSNSSRIYENEVSRAGQAISLENSSQNIIDDNLVFDSDSGINLVNSSSNVVSDNTISDFYLETPHANNGITISHFSNNNTFVNNDIIKMSSHGISVNQSSDNFFIRNFILNCEGHGFTLQFSNNSILDGNLVQNIGYEALEMDRSNFNNIFHNSFVDNSNHTFLTDSFGNIWDDGYPSGGNYWDDYNGTDSYNGPFQNETGSDNIGDTPYNVDDLNQDRYPLMRSNRLRWDVTGDGYVGIDDIVAVAEHFGQDPTHQLWENKYDVTGDNYIGIDDIVSIAEHFGESV